MNNQADYISRISQYKANIQQLKAGIFEGKMSEETRESLIKNYEQSIELLQQKVRELDKNSELYLHEVKHGTPKLQ